MWCFIPRMHCTASCYLCDVWCSSVGNVDWTRFVFTNVISKKCLDECQRRGMNPNIWKCQAGVCSILDMCLLCLQISQLFPVWSLQAINLRFNLFFFVKFCQYCWFYFYFKKTIYQQSTSHLHTSADRTIINAAGNRYIMIIFINLLSNSAGSSSPMFGCSACCLFLYF